MIQPSARIRVYIAKYKRVHKKKIAEKYKNSDKKFPGTRAHIRSFIFSNKIHCQKPNAA